MTTPRHGFINEDKINFIDYVNGAYSRPTGSEPVPRQSLIQEPMDRFENSILHLKDDGTSIETYQDIVRRARKWQHLLNKSNNIIIKIIIEKLIKTLKPSGISIGF